MKDTDRRVTRYWGDRSIPKLKTEFFDAVTTPAPIGTGTIATIRMYGPIDSWGGFWGISTKDVGQVLDALPDSVTQIILRINSPGGEVFEGVSILNMLRAHKASVTAVVDGLAASAASFIAAGCDETVMSPGTQMMIHSPLTIAYGNAAELRKTAEVLDGLETSIVEIYRTKAGEKDWAALLAADTWMTAAETVEQGLADRVAVIPDAGEAETVGEEEPDIVMVPLGGEAEDSAQSTRIAAFTHTHTNKLPSQSEPGETDRKETVAMSDILKAGISERLGITDANASDETLLAALDETLAEQADSTTTSIPEGTVLMDSAALGELRTAAQAGVTALAAQDSARRDQIVASAVTEGRIAPSSRDTWRAQLDTNEEGTASLLASLTANSVPVSAIGRSDSPEATADDALYSSLYPSKKEGA